MTEKPMPSMPDVFYIQAGEHTWDTSVMEPGTQYTRSDLVTAKDELLRRCKEAIFSLNRFHAFEVDSDKQFVIETITAIDAALGEPHDQA